MLTLLPVLVVVLEGSVFVYAAAPSIPCVANASAPDFFLRLLVLQDLFQRTLLLDLVVLVALVPMPVETVVGSMVAHTPLLELLTN